MLFTGSGSLPKHIYCWVDSSFVRNGVSKDAFEPCVWFALHSKPSEAWGCHVMLECGAVWRGVPPHALAFSRIPKFDWRLTDAQVWDCYGDQFSIEEYKYLQAQRVEVRDSGDFGRYLFTVIPMNDGFTNHPSQSKEFMFVELDNGRLTILPTNKLRFHDQSFTDGDWPTDLRLNNMVWRCE